MMMRLCCMLLLSSLLDGLLYLLFGLVFNESRRYLRARKFDVNGAWGQFKDTEDWRKENAIESLYENIDIDSYEAARRMVSYFIFLCLHLEI